jgi:hypothetical protein
VFADLYRVHEPRLREGSERDLPGALPLQRVLGPRLLHQEHQVHLPLQINSFAIVISPQWSFTAVRECLQHYL